MPQPKTKNIPTHAGVVAPCLPARAIELLAAAAARLIDANAHVTGASTEHAGAHEAGLELPQHAALSVPTGERHRPEPESPRRCDPEEPDGR